MIKSQKKKNRRMGQLRPTRRSPAAQVAQRGWQAGPGRESPGRGWHLACRPPNFLLFLLLCLYYSYESSFSHLESCTFSTLHSPVLSSHHEQSKAREQPAGGRNGRQRSFRPRASARRVRSTCVVGSRSPGAEAAAPGTPVRGRPRAGQWRRWRGRVPAYRRPRSAIKGHGQIEGLTMGFYATSVGAEAVSVGLSTCGRI